MKIELLAPAGSPEALDAAIGEGADAVYLGLKDFNARLRSANFTYSQFEGALRSLRRAGKKIYVTVNTVFEQREADRMYQFLNYLLQQEPDAIIVQDFGVIEMAKKEFPSLRLHASTQMNIASARGANALSRHGVSRVVLARELSLEELKSIKSETNLELEVFVHGALCISVSGLCLFSSYLGGKSANRGMCTQACRRLYHRTDRSEGKSGYYFSPNDLQLLELVPDLAAAGITALKIEGRMKSASYVGAVVSAYRLVMDAVADAGAKAYMDGSDDEEIRRSIEQGQEILRNDFARAKTQYFFLKTDREEFHAETQRRGDNEEKEEESNDLSAELNKNQIDWLNPDQDGGTGISLGIIQKVKGSGSERSAFVFTPKGLSLSVHDSVRIHKNDDSARFTQKLIFAENSGSGCWISAEEGSIGDHVYLIQTKEMRRRYAPVIANNVNSRGPGREKAPFPLSASKETAGKKGEAFPEGLYVAVSRPDDLYIVQSSRPQKVILSLSQKNAKALLADNRKPLPFKPADIILTLDPWFPQEAAGYETGWLSSVLEQLIEMGYSQFIVNNPGHFSLFKGLEKINNPAASRVCCSNKVLHSGFNTLENAASSGVLNPSARIKLIAGPWLYTFNSWSLSFITSFGVDGYVCPLENNRQNLERTLGIKSKGSENKTGKKNRGTGPYQSKFFITVFSWPALFNIRANLAPVLDFKTFTDNRDENFSLVTELDGSRVYPQKYFSIIDKIPFLRETGFRRFIIDLSGSAVKKSDYRDLMNSISENAPLPNSGRFNWKDGFYTG